MVRPGGVASYVVSRLIHCPSEYALSVESAQCAAFSLSRNEYELWDDQLDVILASSLDCLLARYERVTRHTNKKRRSRYEAT